MIIGLTGGIATGKSLVSAEFKRLGARVIDADEIAREVVEPGKPAYGEIIEEFGSSVLNSDGTIDRKALAERVFSDKEALSKLNKITHPRIRERIREEIAGAGEDELVVLDVALLIEGPLKDEVDRIVVVYADEEKQIERLEKRNGASREDALRRLASQMPVREKLKFADYVIDNNGEVGETLSKARELFVEFTGAAKTGKKGT
ncbi:MAG: dephospho-CoA kinase [Deltaproteobacteria bacterium]|nr:dephospho-CoA kinase [Deltaproteobacteria bacterium]MBZ0220227.1 dephospho-CoA kinase [Deltaproteobacteria bacterium]